MSSSIVSEEILNLYISQLPEKDQKTYAIAREHLGSSFDLELSLGFIKWKKKYDSMKKK